MKTAFKKKGDEKTKQRLPVLVSSGSCLSLLPADTVPDHQDTMSGEPPGDATTKSPFQQVTEQPFTFDYDDATYSQGIEEEGGKRTFHKVAPWWR